MSVSAPFVWRCLSGSAVAPFPWPFRYCSIFASDEATYYEGAVLVVEAAGPALASARGISSTQSDRCFRTFATWAAVTGGAELPQFARTKVASLAMSASP
jgi:hypothetical protein